MNKFTIALVDDHILFRSGLKALFNSYPNYQIVIEANNGDEFLQKISNKFYPDAVLLDLNMPKMGGLELAIILREKYPHIKIVILSMQLDDDVVLKLIKAGINGYLLKDSDKEEFLNCIEAVKQGDIYFSNKVNRILQKSFTTKKQPKPQLSIREQEFLTLLCQELSYKEIADKLKVSVRTVDGYRDQLFYKLNINNKIGLVLYAIRNNLVEI